MFKTRILLLASVGLVVLLTACGQKGPLFMPNKSAQLIPTTQTVPGVLTVNKSAAS
ncbi:lipoprotein [Undibacterium sp. RTI2.2]|uniref:LPS translocon maturation chaperone LptM n=1 Tax=unclassified Undibacterium TaxID=2630295 RepID=UPI002AB5B32A|nr:MULTISPECIES: lipoprotein [unclassified Undibacterium]MDY7539253.1 lipoprotein [Undibacterium sp. 5I1]MEB0116205.1 lipoprotein [Undibacterium sp. RTI2.2]MEB0231729.1 lipoprotein [Undibacterium sp. 10I3]MEB0256947.1 lipoprotein [Undibacterium sp. 5I1]